MIHVQEQPGGAAALWHYPLGPDILGLAWLGQAGFLVRYRELRILIDPYLSDHLAQKYRGTRFPHIRMMTAPLAPADLTHLDWVFCTHRHSDHMDPGTLPWLASNNPDCRFVVPAAEREAAVKAGLPWERTLLVNAGQTHPLPDDTLFEVLPAAHEQFQINPLGEHHFLGFVLQLGSFSLYHSGDCVPFPGQAELLESHGVKLALLPVNGRDENRRTNGIPGNMTFQEATALCRQAHIPRLMPHHFGMFDFNTVDPVDLTRWAAAQVEPICTVPQTNLWYSICDQSFTGSTP